MFTESGIHRIDRPVSRRQMLRGGAGLAGGLLLARPLIATATPARESTAADVAFTVTADTIKGPAEIASGINRVTLENQTGQNGVHCLTLQFPQGLTLDQFKAWIASQTGENDPVPDWWLQATMVGNPDWPPVDGISEGHIDYPAGAYVIMNIFGNQWASFTVMDDAKAAEPAATVKVETKLMSFTGLDSIAPGRHLWKVTNTDMVAHELAIASVPSADVTVQQLIDTLMAADAFPTLPDGYAMLPGGTGIITPGVSMWLQVELPAGNYAAICFAPDGWNGPPHAMMGMVKVFSVE